MIISVPMYVKRLHHSISQHLYQLLKAVLCQSFVTTVPFLPNLLGWVPTQIWASYCPGRAVEKPGLYIIGATS